MTLLTLVMAFTVQTARADYGWDDASMSIGGITTDFTTWSTSGDSPTDLGVVSDMTITSIAFSVWSDANDRGGANMYFRIWDGGEAPVGSDQDLWLGASTRIEGDHNFSISWTGTEDLADAVGLTLEAGKTYYIDMWAKTYGDAGDEWYSGGGANYHAKLTYGTSILTATVTGVESSYDWTGSVIHPVPTVTLGDNVLSSETDYDVTYSEGCTNVGDYTVTITGKGNYAGSIERNFSIVVPTGYYLVGDMNGWNLESTYQLAENTVTSGEYYINNVELSSDQGFKVVHTDDGKTKNVYYPNGMDNDYVISAGGTYDIYFRPNYDGGDDWYEGCIYALTTTTSGSCGDNCAYTLYGNGQLVISGTGPMADYGTTNMPWNSKKSDITSVVIENGVSSIGTLAFYQCENLASVSIPASVTSIGESAFHACGTSATALTVTFATGSELTTIGESAFEGAKLTSITIPAGVTTIGYKAFTGCESLASVSIPASVTTIGSSAFENCSSLATIDIPASVTSIGGTAFRGCDDHATITLHSNPFIDDSAFPNNATVTMNLTAHEGETNEYWTTFYNMNYSFQADVNTQVFKVERNGIDLTMHEIGEGIVNSGTAVVLKTKGGNPVMTKTTSGSSNTEPNTLDYVSDPNGMQANGYMYVLSKGSQGVGFYKLADGNTLGVGKAYLFYTGSNAREFLGFGDTTGINDVRCQKEDVRGEYYDLQGRRVSQPTKGLYIVNGKKVVIK